MRFSKKANYNLELAECTPHPGFLEASGSRQDYPAVLTAEGKLEGDGEYTQIKPYAGMPKEVLLLYSSQARYRVPREILFWLTVACTLALLAVTVAIIVMSPRCLSWWQTSPVYQVYPRSFKDSDGDGVGDLNGIRQQLDHFLHLNIKTVWISPFYKSPMKDFGYDVEDFRAIDPIFGTMQDFENLLAEMHQRGLKLIMDFIPNHTSDKHRWFNLSRAREPAYEDYYIWADCNATDPRPNNWVSIFGNSSWTYDDVRGQCYLHQFLKEQPDLNFRNPNVKREIVDLIRFWLKKGVDGFRMDAVKHIFEASHLRDEPQVDPDKPPEEITTEWDLYHDYTTSQLGLHDLLRDWRAEMDAYSREPGRYRFMVTESYDYHEIDKTMMYYEITTEWDLYHDYTTSQLGLHDLLRDWRAEMDAYSREPGRYRFMVTESYDYHEIDKTMMYYGTPLIKEADFPFNFYLLDLPHNTSGWWVEHLVHLWMGNMPEGRWPNWVVGNHDRPRIATSVGQTYVPVLNMLLLTLPGTPTTYYGEEIGMENINITASHVQDPFGKYNISNSRDPQRSPMQWSGEVNAGFNTQTNLTWLPVHPSYPSVNVEAQRADSGSVLAQYGSLNALRQAELPLNRGWFCYVHADSNVFSFLRELDGLQRAFLMVLNFGKEPATTDLSSVSELPDQLQVLMSTNVTNNGKVFQKSRILTAAGEGLVIRYHTDSRFNPSRPGQCYISEKACYLSVLDLLYKC